MNYYHGYLRFAAIPMLILLLTILVTACNKKSTNNEHATYDPPTGVNIFDWSASWNAAINKIAYMHIENDITHKSYPDGKEKVTHYDS